MFKRLGSVRNPKVKYPGTASSRQVASAAESESFETARHRAELGRHGTDQIDDDGEDFRADSGDGEPRVEDGLQQGAAGAREVLDPDGLGERLLPAQHAALAKGHPRAHGALSLCGRAPAHALLGALPDATHRL